MAQFIFSFKTNRYNLKNALRLAEASKLAYSSEKEINSYIKNRWGFAKFQFFDIADTQAFMIANDNLIILTFCGTESIQDWLTDANVKLIAGPLGKVHKGFLKALECIWNNILYTLAQFQTNSQPIWVTGHSLGGALANLSVAKFLERKIKIYGLYTFGQPRVGDKTFAKNFDAKFKDISFRFINNEDIVTRIPPRAARYEHIGNAFYFDNLGKLHRGMKFWQVFLDSSISMIIRASDRYLNLKKQFPNGVEDHSIDTYIRLIKNNFKSEK